MKKNLLRRFFATVLLLAITTLTWAYDFESNGIYYNINADGVSVAVTYGTTSYNSYAGSINIPSQVTYNSKTYSVTGIGLGAFSSCYNLTSITIPNSVTSIGSDAFLCTALTSIDIPSSVKSIGYAAFYKCTNLSSITIPNSVESIENGAFENTAWYDNQPDGLVYAGRVAYKYKGTIPEGTHITIKEGTLGIATMAFYSCGYLTSVTLPNSVTNIGSGAFSYTNLQSFNIPKSVTSMKGNPFSDTPWYYSQPNGVVYAGKFVCGYKGDMPKDTHITIKEGTYGIAERAFYNRSGLTSVTIPNSVISIGDDAFGLCGGLTSIIIPNSVTSIGSYAFNDCYSLTSVTIPNSVTSIGDHAFSDCSSLTSLTIPNSVTSIEYDAFLGCSGLTSVTLPNSLARISEALFANCSSLTSITIPNSVTSIGSYAFRFCSSLTSVTLGNNVTIIGESAFEDCSSLKSVTCQARSVPMTGKNCFRYAPTNSATLYVPESSVEAYKSAFPWSNFGTILPIPYDFEDNGLAYNINPDGTSVTLMSCTSVNSAAGDVVIPSKVTYDGTTYYVTSIGDNAFDECLELASVTIPSSVTSIGEKAFHGCSRLKNVVCKNQNIPTTGDGCFGAILLSSVTLYVPSSAVNDYKSTSPWSGFGTVTSIPNYFKVWDIKLNKTEIILGEQGDPYQLTASVAPEYAANKTLTWTSSNTSVATVDANGLVTPVNQGMAVITATTQDGSNLSAKCVVTVDANNVIIDVSQLSNNRCYYIYTKDQLRGGLGVNTEYSSLATTFSSVSNAQCKTESMSPFVFFNYNDKFYLYSVEANAFVTNTGSLTHNGVTVSNEINITKNTNESFMISFASTGNILNINTYPGIAINDWGTSSSQYDEGNQFVIEVAGNFDPSTIIDMIQEYEEVTKVNAEHYAQAPVQSISSLVNSQVYTAVTKRAAWYVPASSTQLESTIVPIGVDLSCRNTGQQFAFILYNGKYYVYSVGEKKILNGITNNSPNRGVLVTENCQPVTISETSDTQYPLFFSYGTSYNVNIDGSGRVTIDSWTYMDEGNMVALRPVQGVTLSDSVLRRIIGYIDGYITGDANGNGEVEIGDVTSVLTLMATPEATGYNNKAADANGNGEIEIGDVTTILTIMAGN